VKRIAVFLVLGAVALVAGWRWLTAEPAGGHYLPVERRDLVITVEVEGELEAVESLELGPPNVRSIGNFKISMLVPEGTEVKEGQPVLAFDTTDLQRRLQQKIGERDTAAKELEKKSADLLVERREAQLELAQAEAALRRAELELAVPEEVAERAALEKARIDRKLAKVQIEAARSRIEHIERRGAAELSSLRGNRDRAARRVEELEQTIRDMTVLAPRGGTVIHIADWQGEKKKEGDTVWRADKVVEIPDLDRMHGRGFVGEAEAGRLREGQSLTFRLDAHPDHPYRGTIQRIHRLVGQRTPRSPEKVVRVEIELEATDRQRMRPGMRFRGEIEVERLGSVLVLPQEAVRVGPEGPWVRVRGGLGTREVQPELGRRNQEFFEVTAGLDEGDRVWTPEGGA
jgi:multidrug efflux pump subunit AcrA (membrane-fusion protein)